MGFFSDLFGIGGNEKVQSNNNGGVYQTAYMTCQYCQHVGIEYDDNGKKIYSCSKGHGQYGKLGNVFIEDEAGNIIENPYVNII